MSFVLRTLKKGSIKLTEDRMARERGGNIDKRTKNRQVAVLLSTDRSNHIIDGVLSEIQLHLGPHIKGVTQCDDARAYVNIAKTTIAIISDGLVVKIE